MLLHLVDRRQARLMLRGRLLVIAVPRIPQPALTNDIDSMLSSDLSLIAVNT
jgi:hypothetical protein